MNEPLLLQPAGFPKKLGRCPAEFKIVAMREFSAEASLCDSPEHAERYWREHITDHPFFNQEVECFVILLLNSRKRLKGHNFVSIGTLDTILVHPREVFRAAVIGAAAEIILMHNHPSGDPTPSDADCIVTRNLIRAGQLLKIEVIDHVVIGRTSIQNPLGYSSLRELGYFHS